MNNTNWNQKTISELEEFLKNKIAVPGTESYATAREVWAATDSRPAMICLCETTEDVQAAVVLATKKGIPLSVRGGGHDWQGRAFVHQGLVIDLSKMKKIKLDVEAKSADIEGGVNALDLTTAVDPYDLIAVVGTSGVVSVTGFTLGGGYGLTSPANGLGIDNLLGAEVVLADGSLVTASATENPDLLWALRGGRGMFGVVTSIRIQLHPAKPVLAGFIMFPLSDAENVLKGVEEIMHSAPDGLYIIMATASAPNGIPLLLISPTWNGDIKEGENAIAALRKLGNPITEQIHELRMKDLVASFSPFIFNGRHHYMKTRWVSKLTPELITAIVEATAKKTSEISMISFFQMHGAPARVPLAEAAFGLREPHYMLSIAAEWLPEDAANSSIHKKWADDLFEFTAPYSLPGGYPNLLGSEDYKQISESYGSNLTKVQAIKKKFDPNGIFLGQVFK
jgi:hypothetical protein